MVTYYMALTVSMMKETKPISVSLVVRATNLATHSARRTNIFMSANVGSKMPDETQRILKTCGCDGGGPNSRGNWCHGAGGAGGSYLGPENPARLIRCWLNEDRVDVATFEKAEEILDENVNWAGEKDES